MNNHRRKQLKLARNNILDGLSTIETAKDDEQAYFDDMPEGIQDSDKGTNALDAVDLLQDVHDNLAELCDTELARLDEIL